MTIIEIEPGIRAKDSVEVFRWNCRLCRKRGRWLTADADAMAKGKTHAKTCPKVLAAFAPPKLFGGPMAPLPPGRILENVSPDDYHQRDGLSSSIAKTVVAQSPLHAKFGAGKKPTKDLDFGNIGHRLFLGKGKAFKEIEFDDYKSNAAKEARDAAREEGLIPVLTKDLERAKKLADTITAKLKGHGIVLDGQSEVAIEWYEETSHGPLLCRAMFDHVWLTRGVILDLKITGDACPDFVERNSERLGYAIQCAAYRRGLQAVRPELEGRGDFLFVFAEKDEPFALNIERPSGAFRELGERRWLRACETWAGCLKAGAFPGYDAHGVNVLQPPGWVLRREELEAW